MGLTLISVSRIASAGFTTIFRQRNMKIFGPRSAQLGQVPVVGGLYRVEHLIKHESAASASADTLTMQDFHRRMGHISPTVARSMIEKGMVEGVNWMSQVRLGRVTPASMGKRTGTNWEDSRDVEAKNIGEEVHSDVWGPSPVKTINGREYYVTFTDDHSRYTHLYLL